MDGNIHGNIDGTMLKGDIMKQKQQMRVVTLAATKGGVGKTTLASAIAVRAAQDGGKVALLDTDPQCSLMRWWELRGEPQNPKIMEIDASLEALGLLMAEGWDWVIIDTPPALYDRIESAIFCADVVLIPTRASAIDIEAVDDVVELCTEHEKRFAFVLNAVSPSWGKLTDTAAAYLKNHGPVLSDRVSLRKAYVSAMTVGKSGAEIDRDGKAREEINALWSSIKRLASKSSKAVR